MTLFEAAGDHARAIDAASLGAAHASRLGELSLASELATKSLIGLDSVEGDRFRLEITNRLGIFCYSFLDYDRAVEQFERSLAIAERMGDTEKICRELQNIADALLLASRQRRISGLGVGTDQLERAEQVVRRLLREGTEDINRRFGSYRLLVEVLCDLGRADESLQVLNDYRDDVKRIVHAAQRAAIALVEARCLRLVGRVHEALDAAHRGVKIVEASNDEHELMLAIEELAACEAAVGDFESAFAHAREVKGHLFSIHQNQTRQVAQQVWERVDLERDHRNLQTQATEAARSAEHDPLTGLGNRRRLERFLNSEGVRHASVGCIIADVDSFKEINDTFGHDVGDVVLQMVGRLFASKVRSGQQVIRYGGDEFVVAMSGVDLAAASGFAERLRVAASDLDWAAVAPGLQVTVSLGVACGLASRWQAVFVAADAQLLAAKRRGRNTVMAAPV
jgi:diguanylate cyclase (GGDEF)-like protein